VIPKVDAVDTEVKDIIAVIIVGDTDEVVVEAEVNVVLVLEAVKDRAVLVVVKGPRDLKESLERPDPKVYRVRLVRPVQSVQWVPSVRKVPMVPSVRPVLRVLSVQ
jgi:hypothetical protein